MYKIVPGLSVVRKYIYYELIYLNSRSFKI